MLNLIQTAVSREDLVSVALGKKDADIVIENGQLIDVFSGEIRPADVAIQGERIAFVGEADHTIGEKTQVIDAKGLFLSPGLMDAHVHIEASMVTPTEFARAVLPRGNTSVNWETLWTANVLGVEGIKLLLEECNRTPLKFFATAAEGVPCASPDLITSAQEFSLDDLGRMLEWEQIVGLGEVVLFNEVLKNDPKVHQQIQLALKRGKTVDGSSPGFKGRNLNAYLAAGIQSDHEAITLDEAMERIRLGMRLVIREGSSMRNLTELIKAIAEKKLNSRRCCFCVDDKDIREIAREGLIDDLVRKAIKAGVDPVVAIQMASLNPAEYFGVDRDLGGIAPGRIADILLIDDLENFSVQTVIVNGKIIARQGKLVTEIPPRTYPQWMVNTVRLRRPVAPDDFVFKTDRKRETQVHVLKVFREQIISVEERATLTVKNGEILPDITQDILKISVIERHGKTTPNIAKGFVRGFGLKEGAIASSISPDIHQIVVVGINNIDMAKAVNRLVELQGGIAICSNGEILGESCLPVGGLMSQEPYERAIDDLEVLSNVAKEIGCDLPSPFMTLAFSACPTLTEFKLSDKGLIDICAGKLVALEVE
ncbi:MAG: adenine deaminase [Xenococcaceae cyanobacterium MO_188.B32]|nr:adenine deaminase [Xenococcaceae cyanobacterium MO_188.B32]